MWMFILATIVNKFILTLEYLITTYVLENRASVWRAKVSRISGTVASLFEGWGPTATWIPFATYPLKFMSFQFCSIKSLILKPVKLSLLWHVALRLCDMNLNHEYFTLLKNCDSEATNSMWFWCGPVNCLSLVIIDLVVDKSVNLIKDDLGSNFSGYIKSVMTWISWSNIQSNQI